MKLFQNHNFIFKLITLSVLSIFFILLLVTELFLIKDFIDKFKIISRNDIFLKMTSIVFMVIFLFSLPIFSSLFFQKNNYIYLIFLFFIIFLISVLGISNILNNDNEIIDQMANSSIKVKTIWIIPLSSSILILIWSIICFIFSRKIK